MSLDSALGSALKGLNLNQKNMYLSSFNVAHAADKDYYRLESETSNDRLGDVSIKRVKVVMNTIIEQNRIEQNSVVGYSKIKEFFLGRMSDIFGSPLMADNSHDEAMPKNISTAVEDFFDKINMLATTPENNALRRSVVNSAHHFSHMMHHQSNGLHNLRLQADSMIGQTCVQIQQELEGIHHINYELLYLDADNERSAHLKLNRTQAIQRLSECLDIETQTEKNGSIYMYTGNGHPLLEGEITTIAHEPLYELEDMLAHREFAPIVLKSGFHEQALDAEQISSGKIKGLLEVRDQEIAEVLSYLDNFSVKITSEVNKIYSMGNAFPGHRHLSSAKAVEVNELSGTVKLMLLNENGNNASIENNYIVRPLTIDLHGKDLTQVAEEINQHYSFGASQVKIANKIDDVQLIPILGEGLAFDVRIENAQEASDLIIRDVSILYDDNKLFSKKSTDISITASSYETINTPIALEIDDLPSVVEKFTVRVTINVDGTSTAVEYVVNRHDLQNRYAAVSVVGQDAKITTSHKKQYMQAQYKDNIFTVSAEEKLYFAVEDIDSNSTKGHFLHAMQFNNLFLENDDNSAFNLEISSHLEDHPVDFNVASVTYDKRGLPRIGMSNNWTVKKLLALSNHTFDFSRSRPHSLYSFAAFIIEDAAFKSHEASITHEHELSFQDALEDEQKKISGVNIDEEIANSMFLKNWHEALTNIVQLVDKMFADLVNII